MKKVFLFNLLLFCSYLYPQKSDVIYTDISPDGKSKSTYKSSEVNSDGYVSVSSGEIPFGLTPDWSSTLERQIGGMAWGDYDNDGDLDLATGCYFSNSYPPIPQYEVLIYRNDNGVLTTTPAWISTDMRSTTDLLFGDLDGDGRSELIAANGDNSFVSSVIYFNGPSGLNNAPGWISQDNNWTVGAALCDIDDDGDLDLAFGNQGNSVIPTKPICIFYNDGGTFPTVPNWLSSDVMITNSVAFGDLGNEQIRYLNIEYYGDGIRYAFPLPFFPIYSVDEVIVDGEPFDAYCYSPVSGWLSLGTIPQPGVSVNITYAYVSQGDLAASKWVNYQSGIYFNNNGLINPSPGWTVGNTSSQKGIAWADFDKDGYQDLAISGSGVQTVIYKNESGTLTGPIWTANSANTSTQELITGDLDRDGYPELAIVHFGGGRVEIFKNRNGVLDTNPTWIYVAGSSATSISFGDVNGDGALDLAIGTARTPVVVFLNQTPIPVELESFNALVKDNNVQLNWITATETNNQGFEIQRKKIEVKNQKSEWEKIGFIPGYGTTTEKHIYSFNDETLSGGHYQYRLKQIDFDGKSKLSKIAEAKVISPIKFLLEQNFPNPFNPSTTLSFVVGQSSFVTLKVYDVLGKEVATLLNEEKPAGNYKFEFFAKDGYVSGVYFYQLFVSAIQGNGGKTEDFVQIKKMILLR